MPEPVSSIKPDVSIREYVDSRIDMLRDQIERMTVTLDYRLNHLGEDISSAREYSDSYAKIIEKSTSLAKSAIDTQFNHTQNSIEALKEYVDLRVRNIESATALATNSMDKRLESMNEFRGQLNDQTKTFISRDEFVGLTNKLDSEIRNLRDTRPQFITRDEFSATVSKLEADVQNLQLSKAMLEGKASTTSVYISWGFSFIGVILGIVGILIGFLP